MRVQGVQVQLRNQVPAQNAPKTPAVVVAWCSKHWDVSMTRETCIHISYIKYHISYIYIYVFIFTSFFTPRIWEEDACHFSVPFFFTQFFQPCYQLLKAWVKNGEGWMWNFLTEIMRLVKVVFTTFFGTSFGHYLFQGFLKRQPELRKIDLKVGWHSLIFKMRENIFNLGHGSQVFSTLWVCHYQKDLPVFIFSSFKHFPNKATWVWFPTCLSS